MARSRQESRVKRYRGLNVIIATKTFTRRNFLPEYREKKPEINKKILESYLEGMTLRGTARLAKCGYTTAIKKFIKYSQITKSHNRKKLLKNKTKCRIIQIDEMHTWIERRECKLYIALAVNGYGQILSLRSGVNRDRILRQMLEDIKTFVSDRTIFYCDDDKKYIPLIEEFYPQTDYVNMKGIETDPYLSHLNFTCALVRNRLSRMNRKSWSFNRSNDRLQLNLELLKSSFNQKFKAA
ncbi:MAG: hypothetical protein OXJ52_07965 [Oligoflexia bacterium]|nr:hypothetical protein [Oligoflexia bacterium]